MVLALLFTTGCGGKAQVQSASNEPAATELSSLPPDETVPGYIPSEVAMPDWLGEQRDWDSVGNTMWFVNASDEGAVAASYDTMEGSWQRYDLDTGEAMCSRVMDFSATDGALWVLLYASLPYDSSINVSSDSFKYYVLSLDLDDGSMSCVPVSFAGESGTESSDKIFNNIIALDADRALLSTENNNYIIDRASNILARPNDGGRGSTFKVNDQVYKWCSGQYYSLNLDTGELGGTVIDCDTMGLSSNAGHMLREKDGAVCIYEPETDQYTKLFTWIEVAMSYSTMGRYFGFENSAGCFFYTAGGRLFKVTPGMKPVKEKLTMVCFGDTSGDEFYHNMTGSYTITDEMLDAIIHFNNTDPEYEIEIRPMSYSSDEERDKILIELATATDIDLLDTSLLPSTAIKAGVLEDLLPYIDADEQIGREDFIQPLLKAMMKDGGLYEYIDKVDLLTISTPAELYPEDGEWTVEYIEQLLADNGDKGIWFGNMDTDKDVLATYFYWAATAEFIDWDSMSCSFDSQSFIDWLRLLKELPVGNGNSDELMEVTNDYARRLGNIVNGVAAGFPESQGTGSYFIKLSSGASATWNNTIGNNTSLGIMASSSHKDGAWRLMRTLMLGNESTPEDLWDGFPTIKARFEKLVDDSVDDEPNKYTGRVDFSTADGEALKQLVYSTTKMVSNDETLVTLIASEVNGYIAGDKTAEDAAAQIQSRVSIYLAEQS
jgi:ABC-type glycerol-3-phosphate transport system substrate-binding protein